MSIRATQLFLVVLTGLALGACSKTLTVDAADATTTSTTTATEVLLDFDPKPPVETWGPPEGEPIIDPAAEFCTGSGDRRIEMAFSGTIRSVDTSAGRPWMVFEVDAWYTDDLGTYMGLWAPDFAGTVDERWLVSASRFTVGNQPAGDLFWCASEPYSIEAAGSWSAEYDGSVIPDSGEPEGTADPEVLTKIESARETWAAQKPPSYTYIVHTTSRSADFNQCGSGPVTVTVDNGKIIQARNIWKHCDVPSEQLTSIGDAFDLASDSAGAIDYDLTINSEFGFIENFYASDRSIEVSLSIRDFQVGAYPLATDVKNDLQTARSKWAATGITSYGMRLDVRCFCVQETRLDVRVVDGVVEPSPEAAENNLALSVNDLFDVIAENLDADGLEVAFHPQHGYPLSVRIDPDFNTTDDEIDYFILSLTKL